MKVFNLKKLVMICSCVLFCVSCFNNSSNELKLIPVKSGEKWGYVNKKGEFVINPQFKQAYVFNDGLARIVDLKGKVGYIDYNGKYKIAATYKSGTDFVDGLAFVVSDGGYPTCIDKSGKTKFVLKQAKFVSSFSEGLAIFGIKNTDTTKQYYLYGFVDKTGKVVINPQFEDAEYFSEGLAAVKQKEKWGFIDKTGKVVINPQFDDAGRFMQGKCAIYNGKQWGYIDSKGSYIINPQFDDARGFTEDGLARVQQGKQWGYINEQGKIEINPQFDDARGFSSGLAAIKQNDKWGFIDKKGKIVINPQFDAVESFIGNIAFVKSSDKLGIIDKDGKYIVNPQFDSIADCNRNYSDYVLSDYYDATEFIKKFFEKAKDNSFDGFDANSTLRNLTDSKLYGDCVNPLRDDNNVAYCQKEQPLTKDLLIPLTYFLFENPIYELQNTYGNYYGYSYSTGETKVYKWTEKIGAIIYRINGKNNTIDFTMSSVAHALKKEIESRYKIKMEEKDGLYIVYQDGNKLSFAVLYTENTIDILVSFKKEYLRLIVENIEKNKNK